MTILLVLAVPVFLFAIAEVLAIRDERDGRRNLDHIQAQARLRRELAAHDEGGGV